jgi:Xaa-Pro aminopeptidase
LSRDHLDFCHGLLGAGLEELGASALLVIGDSSRDPDLAPFTGSAHLGECFVLALPRRTPLLAYLVDMERDEAAQTGLDLLAPGVAEIERARRKGVSASEVWFVALGAALNRVGIEEGVLALAGHPSAGQTQSIIETLEARGFRFVDGCGLVRSLRKAKSRVEVGALRRVAEGTCDAFCRVAEILASVEGTEDALLFDGAPLTAGFLRREIAVTLAHHGLEQPEGNIVASGAEAGVPHTRGADSKELVAGEPIVIDLYPKGRLFADCTRTFCVGESGKALETAHALCSRALEESKAAAMPGVLGADLQSGVSALFEDAGFPTGRSHPGTQAGYVHGLGHGVGYELHELPSFRKASGNSGTLEVGDVFTLEPGLYDPGAGYGVRLEDLFLMTNDGPENLTPLPYHLDPRAW